MLDETEQAKSAAEAIGVDLAEDLNAGDGKLVVVLSLPPSLLRRQDIVVIAATTTIPRGEVERIIKRAVESGLLTSKGRLTEAGQELLKANRRGDRRTTTIATNTESYYPQTLRIPRANPRGWLGCGSYSHRGIRVSGRWRMSF
jgi:hypothetical protein